MGLGRWAGADTGSVYQRLPQKRDRSGQGALAGWQRRSAGSSKGTRETVREASVIHHPNVPANLWGTVAAVERAQGAMVSDKAPLQSQRRIDLICGRGETRHRL